MVEYLPSAIYILCLVMSSLCAFMLGRSYRLTGAKLLLWSALSFVLFAGANLLLVLDLLVISRVDLQIPRALLNLVAISVLLFGFIWNGED
jgi:hypothetical protein